jgi:predicted ATP-grasp superfamily ATP-dependent carboligase
LPVDKTIIANQFIAGRPATSLASAFEGATLATVTAKNVECFPNELGPSSVVRFIHNQEMRRASEKLIGAWGLTGLIGFDFVIDSAGAAWLIECNPRPTPISHLGALVGEDICRALYCRIAGQSLPRLAQEDGLVVARFPTEQLRDPGSPHLTTGLHDVPWDDPGLLEKLLETRW